MTWGFHLKLVKITMIKKFRRQYMLARMWRKRTTLPLLVGFQTCKTTLEINLGFLRKLEIDLFDNPAIPLLGIYPKDAPPYHSNMSTTM